MKIDVKNSHEYDQEAEDAAVSELIIQREDEENLQREAELRLEAEQAERAAEDARLRELIPPEDDQEYEDGEYDGEDFSDGAQLESFKIVKYQKKRRKTVRQQTPVMRICISCRKTYDRKDLLKITKDHNQGIIFQKGMGRSAYICKSKKCYSDSKIKKAPKSSKNFFRT